MCCREEPDAWVKWQTRIQAGGIEPMFVEYLIRALKRTGMSEAEGDRVLKALCKKLKANKSDPREAVRICLDFIDLHLKDEAAFHGFLGQLLQRWEITLPV